MKGQLDVVRTINAPVDKVWRLISAITLDHCRVQGTGIGAVRTLELTGDAKMTDIINEINHRQRRFRYSRTGIPLPVSDYKGTIVRNVDNGQTEITWSTTYEVSDEYQEEMSALIQSTLFDGINGLAQELQPLV